MTLSSKLATYLSLCTEFYDLDKPQASETALNFYLSYARAAQGRILEPMCGTGRFLIPFLKAGYDIAGFDASSFMLAALQQKCQQQNIEPNVWQQFLQTIDFKDKFGLIFIPDSSFCLITDKDKAKLSLQKLYQALLPGGKLVFEVETLKAIPTQLNMWQGKICTRHDGSVIINNTLALAPNNQVGTVICRYELINEGKIIKTEVETLSLRLYEPAGLETLLKEAGFMTIKYFKPYAENQAVTQTDEVLVYECTK